MSQKTFLAINVIAFVITGAMLCFFLAGRINDDAFSKSYWIRFQDSTGTMYKGDSLIGSTRIKKTDFKPAPNDKKRKRSDFNECDCRDKEE